MGPCWRGIEVRKGEGLGQVTLLSVRAAAAETVRARMAWGLFQPGRSSGSLMERLLEEEDLYLSIGVWEEDRLRGTSSLIYGTTDSLTWSLGLTRRAAPTAWHGPEFVP